LWSRGAGTAVIARTPARRALSLSFPISQGDALPGPGGATSRVWWSWWARCPSMLRAIGAAVVTRSRQIRRSLRGNRGRSPQAWRCINIRPSRWTSRQLTTVACLITARSPADLHACRLGSRPRHLSSRTGHTGAEATGRGKSRAAALVRPRAAARGRDRCASADVAVGGVPVFHLRARLGSAGSCPAGPASGGGGLGGGVVVDSADERLGYGLERLGAAGCAAEDQRALERRDGQVGESSGAPGGDAQRLEAGNQSRPPPREHAVETGAEFLVAGGQLTHMGGDGAAALVAGGLEGAGEDLGQRADERGGVTGVAGGLVDQLLHLVARHGDGFAGKFGLATGEVEVGRSAGCAAIADH